MASLTPGVLSKLLENTGNNNVKVIGDHRSPLLQVIEIIPSHDDDPFRSRGFFLKLSDSLHSAYVSISPQDADLIFSDKIQLGQFVYVSRFDSGSPVPVVRGLKALPKRRPCVGSPKDLVSSDLLQLRPPAHFKKESVKGSKTKRLAFEDSKGRAQPEGLELRRLSLDFSRKGWGNNISSPFKSKQIAPSVAVDKKDSSKSISSMKSPSFIISPLSSKNNNVSPNPKSIPSRKEFRSSTGRTVPCHLVKVPLDPKTWSNRMILWDALPPIVQDLGKEAVCQRNVAFLSAVRALEEASAIEAVINCLQLFTELCNYSQKLSAGALVEQFLEVHQSMDRAAAVINSLISNNLPEAKSSTYSSLDSLFPDEWKTLTNRNAMLWVQAAIETDFSKFSLFGKPGGSEIVNSDKYHSVILENTPNVLNSYNHLSESNPNPRNRGSFKSDSSVNRVPSPTKQQPSRQKKVNPERKECCKGSGLKKAASLADKLLLVSHQWFLKYLEDSLKMGFGLSRGEGSSEIACLFRQLKRVNEWLDSLVKGGLEANDRIESLRKKLYRFLLEHVESSVAGK
ncbi:uncharacterized protein LOC123196023 isoform X2 [Mangifera indica]|uniref:uncharacterized protein LOC123196023 isoform X2 n=1 Tax=Mangifera indica TaxID=29780 RepID=UPI001CFACEDE|nr:uncharacterized protein LOC123196023 isoform X2 [Mangifera indica]